MRAWPVTRSIFDAMLPSMLCERSERADSRLDKRSRCHAALRRAHNGTHARVVARPFSDAQTTFIL